MCGEIEHITNTNGESRQGTITNHMDQYLLSPSAIIIAATTMKQGKQPTPGPQEEEQEGTTMGRRVHSGHAHDAEEAIDAGGEKTRWPTSSSSRETPDPAVPAAEEENDDDDKEKDEDQAPPRPPGGDPSATPICVTPSEEVGEADEDEDVQMFEQQYIQNNNSNNNNNSSSSSDEASVTKTVNDEASCTVEKAAATTTTTTTTATTATDVENTASDHEDEDNQNAWKRIVLNELQSSYFEDRSTPRSSTSATARNRIRTSSLCSATAAGNEEEATNLLSTTSIRSTLSANSQKTPPSTTPAAVVFVPPPLPSRYLVRRRSTSQALCASRQVRWCCVENSTPEGYAGVDINSATQFCRKCSGVIHADTCAQACRTGGYVCYTCIVQQPQECDIHYPLFHPTRSASLIAPQLRALAAAVAVEQQQPSSPPGANTEEETKGNATTTTTTTACHQDPSFASTAPPSTRTMASASSSSSILRLVSIDTTTMSIEEGAEDDRGRVSSSVGAPKMRAAATEKGYRRPKTTTTSLSHLSVKKREVATVAPERTTTKTIPKKKKKKRKHATKTTTQRAGTSSSALPPKIATTTISNSPATKAIETTKRSGTSLQSTTTMTHGPCENPTRNTRRDVISRTNNTIVPNGDVLRRVERDSHATTPHKILTTQKRLPNALQSTVPSKSSSVVTRDSVAGRDPQLQSTTTCATEETKKAMVSSLPSTRCHVDSNKDDVEGVPNIDEDPVYIGWATGNWCFVNHSNTINMSAPSSKKNRIVGHNKNNKLQSASSTGIVSRTQNKKTDAGTTQSNVDEENLERSKVFSKWNTLAEGEQLQYAGNIFCKGHDDDENRLIMHCIYVNRKEMEETPKILKAPITEQETTTTFESVHIGVASNLKDDSDSNTNISTNSKNSKICHDDNAKEIAKKSNAFTAPIEREEISNDSVHNGDTFEFDDSISIATATNNDKFDRTRVNDPEKKIAKNKIISKSSIGRKRNNDDSVNRYIAKKRNAFTASIEREETFDDSVHNGDTFEFDDSISIATATNNDKFDRTRVNDPEKKIAKNKIISKSSIGRKRNIDDSVNRYGETSHEKEIPSTTERNEMIHFVNLCKKKRRKNGNEDDDNGFFNNFVPINWCWEKRYDDNKDDNVDDSNYNGSRDHERCVVVHEGFVL